MDNNSVQKTVLVALVLCIVCSVFISSAAVLLRPRQEFNAALDVKKNLLLASGLLDNPRATAEEIEEAYKQVEEYIISFETGEVAEHINPEELNERRMANSPDTRVRIPSELDKGSIRSRAPYGRVYLTRDENGDVDLIILPVHGQGLWSTMYAFLALDASDTKTVRGIGFYEHGETPGLGGEVDNPRWQAQWEGKKVFDDEFRPVFEVLKGQVDSTSANAVHQVDGLAGATITAYGAGGMVQYWTSHHAYGKYLENFRHTKNMDTSDYYYEDHSSEEVSL